MQSVKSLRRYEHDSSTFSLRETILSQQRLPRDKKIAVRRLKAPFGKKETLSTCLCRGKINVTAGNGDLREGMFLVGS